MSTTSTPHLVTEQPEATFPGDLAPDFADVYSQHLHAVWRFVRARVRDDHLAHDVAADVFVRAWRSWDRFEPSRPVGPWLFTIARRTVIDHLRRPDLEDVVAAAPEQALDLTPEQEVLKDELLESLGTALEGLAQRDREALALRFAARLSIAHVAEVLGTTAGSARMVLHRAVRRLADAMEAADRSGVDVPGPADLESVIDDVLARGHEAIAEPDLRRLLVHVAAAHDHDVPDSLGSHVTDCVRCEAEGADAGARRSSGGAGGRAAPAAPARPGGATGGGHGVVAQGGRLAAVGASVLSFAGVCLACTVPALHALLVTLGIVAAGYVLHLVGVAAAPFVLWLVWRGMRRHGLRRGYRVARVGALVMGVHALFHVALEGWGEVVLASGWAVVAFVGTDWVGTGLLVVGAALNVADLHRWRRAQAAQVRALALGTA